MYSEAALMQQSSDNPYRTVYQQYHSKENFTEDDYMNPNAYNSSEVDAILEEALSSTMNQIIYGLKQHIQEMVDLDQKVMHHGYGLLTIIIVIL